MEGSEFKIFLCHHLAEVQRHILKTKISFNSKRNCSKISDTISSDCIKTFKYANFHMRPQVCQHHKETLSILLVVIQTFYASKMLYCKIIDKGSYL